MAPKNTLSGGMGASFEQLSVPAMLTKEDCRELMWATYIVFKAANKPLSASQFRAYFFETASLIVDYRFARMVRGKSTFRDIVRPISEVIAKLEQSENIGNVLLALGAPPTAEFRPDDESAQPAIAQYETLLYGLRKIRDMVPAPPKKRKGKQKAHDLYSVVNRLADIWETFTGEPFTQDWENGEPISEGAEFVHAILKIADPTRLQKVPNVTARTVTSRRKKSRKRPQPAS